MLPKKWTKGAISVLLVIFILAGFAVVAAEYGSSEDPLVSFSYITDVLMPNLSQTVDSVVTEKSKDFDAQMDKKINEFTAEIEGKIASGQTGVVIDASNQALVDAVAAAVIEKMGSQSSGGAAAADTYKVIDVANGKTLTGKVGTEILLRIGSATCVAPSSPGLIDLTSATDLAAGKELAQNHLYIVTVDGRGLKATAAVKVLIRGDYTIS